MQRILSEVLVFVPSLWQDWHHTGMHYYYYYCYCYYQWSDDSTHSGDTVLYKYMHHTRQHVRVRTCITRDSISDTVHSSSDTSTLYEYEYENSLDFRLRRRSAVIGFRV